jgi:hypothetical protein
MPEPIADEAAHDLNPDYRAVPPPVATWDQISARLSAARIDYFVVWPNCTVVPPKTSLAAKAGDVQLLRINPSGGVR